MGSTNFTVDTFKGASSSSTRDDQLFDEATRRSVVGETYLHGELQSERRENRSQDVFHPIIRHTGLTNLQGEYNPRRVERAEPTNKAAGCQGPALRS
jgi:hypothetical protein